MFTQADADAAITAGVSREMIEELAALKYVNDTVGGPSFIAKIHWEQSGYKYLVEAGFVKWGDPPKGFGAERFAGTTITKKGREALAFAQKQ